MTDDERAGAVGEQVRQRSAGIPFEADVDDVGVLLCAGCRESSLGGHDLARGDPGGVRIGPVGLFLASSGLGQPTNQVISHARIIGVDVVTSI
ncbi:hypothetical protein ACWEOS_26790 [Micromonospora taraxaci]